MNVVFHVAVEGNIAAGKSTLIKNLKNVIQKCHKVGVEIMLEPVETWTRFGSHQINYLGLAYNNPSVYSHRFQVMAATTKLDQFQEFKQGEVKRNLLNPNKKVTILLVERSIETQLEVFLKALEDQKRISTEDSALVEFIQKTLQKVDGMTPDFTIFLKTSPHEALRRLVSRGRHEEDGVKLADLVRLEDKHRDWLLSPRFRNLLTIDADDIAGVDVKELAKEVVLRALAKANKEEDIGQKELS